MAEPHKKNSEEVCFTEMVPDDCPVLTSIRIIGGKWKIPILYTLRNETLRFNELQKALPGVTQKWLSQLILGKIGNMPQRRLPYRNTTNRDRPMSVRCFRRSPLVKRKAASPYTTPLAPMW